MSEQKNIRYRCCFISDSGDSLDLTEALTALSWQESMDELAAKAQATLINCQTEQGSYLHSIVRPGGKICFFADSGDGFQEVFRGTIWNWDYTGTKERLLTITAYDDLIYLQKSKEHRYFSAGQQTKNIIQSMAAAWGIPLQYQWKSIVHGKRIFKNKTIGEIIFSVLDEAKLLLGESYVVRSRGGMVYVLPQGGNLTSYTLSAQESVLSTQNQISLDRLVTKVLLSGKDNSGGQTPILATVGGKTQYGTLQQIVPYTRGSSLSELKKKGESLIREQGKPQEIITVTAMDIPLLGKGDLLAISAGNLLGSFYVTGVHHAATTKKMTVTLQRKAGEAGA